MPPRRHVSLRSRLIALVVAFTACLALAAPAGAALPRDFIGLGADDVFAGDPNYRTSNLSAQSAIGVGLLRQLFNWKDIETAPGQYNFAVYDEYVAKLAAHGMTVLPIIFNPPDFRSSAPATGARRGTYPPKSNADMAAFAAELVRRYGPTGSFWAQRPDVPRIPIKSWQVWNEPNLPVYWATGPSAKKYAAMLKVTAKAIKGVDRGAEVVSAGIPDSKLRGSISVRKFIEGLYKAGGKSGFDTLAINTYARNERDLQRGLTAIRKLMKRFRDSRAPIWATEIGWSDVGPPSPFRAGVQGQATRITRAFRTLGKIRRKIRLRGVVYYYWRDAPPYPPLYKDFWGLHTGLLRLDGTFKPAYLAFKEAVSKLR